jgi:large subunit ribosomal protein L24
VIFMTISARKQRKRLYGAHTTERRNSMIAPLSKELSKQRNIRRIPVRKGDTVLVVKGDREIRGIEGKVSSVDTVKRRVLIDGVTIPKSDGKQTARPVSFSNLVITALAPDGKRKTQAEGGN